MFLRKTLNQSILIAQKNSHLENLTKPVAILKHGKKQFHPLYALYGRKSVDRIATQSMA